MGLQNMLTELLNISTNQLRYFAIIK